MLSLEEALLLKAAQEETEKQEAQQAGLLAGGLGGAALGAAAGNIPHQIGRGINTVMGRTPARFKSGSRIAGGLTGLMLGGAMGAGVAAMAKQGDAGNLLGKIQAKGSISSIEEQQLAELLGELYTNPSQMQ